MYADLSTNCSKLDSLQTLRVQTRQTGTLCFVTNNSSFLQYVTTHRWIVSWFISCLQMTLHCDPNVWSMSANSILAFATQGLLAKTRLAVAVAAPFKGFGPKIDTTHLRYIQCLRRILLLETVWAQWLETWFHKSIALPLSYGLRSLYFPPLK